jgi:hypothetical protein
MSEPGSIRVSAEAESELRGIAGRICDQTSEPGIAVDLKQSAIPLQMFRRVNAFAIIAVNVDGGWVTRPPLALPPAADRGR